MSSAQAPVFEAFIVPHRSLTRRGSMILVGVMMAASLAVALRFLFLGAWPVVAFSLLDVPLIVLLLAINFRRGRASELLMLSAQEFIVVRTDPAGKRKQVTLPSAWLRVDLDEARGIPRLLLTSHGRGCEVGAFLHEPEKRSLFAALNGALHSVKNPYFDNPQLRDN